MLFVLNFKLKLNKRGLLDNNSRSSTIVLPFLKNKKAAGLILSPVKPQGSPRPDGRFIDIYSEESNENNGLVSCAQDLLKAIEMKDPKAMADAMKAAFQILDSEPHVEGPHLEDYSE